MKQAFSRSNGLTVKTPAKLNLFFEILGRRKDGFHEIETIVLPINLFDTIKITPLPFPADAEREDFSTADSPSRWLRFHCCDENGSDLSGKIEPEKNLAYQAAVLLAEAAHFWEPVEITLIKGIPSEAGLGGGSSDAAAVLFALNYFWQTALSDAQLAELGGQLGSDVPLFLTPGLTRGSGRGERIEPLFPIRELYFALYKPPVGLATGKVYGNWNGDTANRRTPDRLLTALKEGNIQQAAKGMFNRLEEPAGLLWPDLEPLLAKISTAGALTARMTGSGTALFAMGESEQAVDELVQQLNCAGLKGARKVRSLTGTSNFFLQES